MNRQTNSVDLTGSEVALRSLFAALDIPVMIVDGEGCYLDANEAALRFLEITLAELRGKRVWDFSPPQLRERHQRDHDPFCGRRTVETEYLVNGRIKTLLLNVVPAVLDGGTVLLGIGNDLTERRRTEEALAWESGVNAAMAELAHALISATDEDVAWLVLEHGKRLTGSRFGFVGHVEPRTGRFIADTMTRDVWDVCKVDNKGAVFHQFGGLWGWVLEHRRPIFSNNPAADPRSTGTPAGHVPIHRFLSAPALMGDTLVGQVALANAERDYDERDLELVQRLAAVFAVAVQQRRMARLRDEFLHLAAHELRTPLTVIKGNAELLMKRGSPDEVKARAIRALKLHSDRVARLTQAMLDVVHIQSGGLRLVWETLDLCALAREVVATVQREAPGHHLAVLAEGEVLVSGDRRRLATVLLHLLENAVRFSPEGGPVEVAVGGRGKEAVVAVRDYGVGIPPERQAEVFEAFYQVQPMVSPTSGMGLGLYISREIISRHGGRVWVESEVGKGSVFSFTLPLPQ